MCVEDKQVRFKFKLLFGRSFQAGSPARMLCWEYSPFDNVTFSNVALANEKERQNMACPPYNYAAI